jgi:hypothetical protein
MTWQPLADSYREAISICFDQNLDYKGLLNTLKKIPGIKDSFATKHMFFWTEYGPRRDAIPIYDARIKTLLCFNETKAVDYQTFYNEMKNSAELQKLTVGLVERALFAFSQNYFRNNTLIIKSSPKDTTDFDEALNLQKRYLEFNTQT